jgi:hypothetical protein
MGAALYGVATTPVTVINNSGANLTVYDYTGTKVGISSSSSTKVIPFPTPANGFQLLVAGDTDQPSALFGQSGSSPMSGINFSSTQNPKSITITNWP